jgi:hypothetical protein
MRFIGEIYIHGLVKQSVMKHCVQELIESPEVGYVTLRYVLTLFVLYFQPLHMKVVLGLGWGRVG